MYSVELLIWTDSHQLHLYLSTGQIGYHNRLYIFTIIGYHYERTYFNTFFSSCLSTAEAWSLLRTPF